jgi:hypothetical protein
MNVRRVAWFGVSALAIATWFAAASTSGVRAPVVPVQPVRATALDRSSAVLQSEVARLHARIGPTASPARSRDLFRFNVRAPQRPAPSSRPAVAAVESATPVVALRPALKLIGIAEDTSESGVVRTAIVSGPGELFLVKAGELISGRYRVDQVSADAVLLTDTTTSDSTTLALR